MANNFTITQGSGTTVATEQGTSSEHYQKIKLIDPTAGSTMGIGISSNPCRIDPTGTTVQPVSGTFFQATQPISAVNLPLPSSAATDASLTNGNLKAQIIGGGNLALVDATGDLQVDVMNPVQVAASTLCISATATTGVAVTATLPAVASNFHYISLIEIHKYFTVANVASATPLVVTSTNLPGSLAFTFGQPLGAIGVTDERIYAPNSPLKSSVLNTATTIVCPATTGIIWRVNVFYFTAP